MKHRKVVSFLKEILRNNLRKNAAIFPNSTGTGTSPKKVKKIWGSGYNPYKNDSQTFHEFIIGTGQRNL